MEPIDTAQLGCSARDTVDGQPVRWLGPVREGDRRTLDAWCAAVGPVEVRSDRASAAAASSRNSGITIVTWNVKVGGGDLVGFLREELGHRCGATSERASPGHFVLLVQEGYRESETLAEVPRGAIVADRITGEPPAGRRLDIVQVAESCGLELFYVPSMRNGPESGADGGEDRGSAILSSLPLSDMVAVELPLEAQRRVVAAATVTAPDGSPLRVASVHYDVANNILRVLISGGSMRVRQNDGLTEALDFLDPDRSLPVVVAGDLNTWSSRETVIQRMLETYPDSPDPGRETTRGSWPPDHLFFRAGSGGFQLVEDSYRVVADEHGSDHRARLAVLVPR